MTAVHDSTRASRTAQASALALDAVAGTLAAVLALSYAIGYGAMIFSASLAPWLAAGMPAVLVSCVVVGLVISLASSVPFMIGGPDSNAAALLAGIASAVAMNVRAGGGSNRAAFATVLILLATASLTTGALLYALAHWKRGNAIQYIPFPVVGGFLAGTGFLILEGAFRVMTGAPLTMRTLPLVARLSWLDTAPALLVGAGLLIGAKFTRRVALVPLVILAGVVVFYAGLFATGQSLDSARHAGLLFQPEPIRDLRLPVVLLRDAWLAPLVSHAAEIVAVAAVTAMTVLLNTTSIGVSTSHDIDFNRELRSAGLSNVLTGALGGIAGCQSTSRTLMNWRVGVRGRRAGVLGALICFLVIGALPDLIALFPKPVIVGLQIYLGGAMLAEWLFYSFRRLPWHDYLLIPAMMLIIATHGIVAGVVLGVVAACLLFVVRYGRINCIRAEFNGRARRSNVERTVDENRLLDREAARLYGIALQGFLFFGTSHSILAHMRARIESSRATADGGVRFVLVDFGRVHGVDASSTASFVRLRQACLRAGAELVLTGLSTPLQAWFRKGGTLVAGVHEFDDLDRGLEWIEDELLASSRAAAQRSLDPGESRLPASLRALRPHLDTVMLAAGEFLFRQADPGNSVYFVESGRVCVALALDDGKTMRLRSFGAGTIVGEMAVYTGAKRSADVIAETPAVVLRLALPTLRRLEAEDPALASRFHEFVVRMLAARLAVANEQLRTSH
ncbi:Bicarbonate transporter BicA [Caballeronia terrestris]|uniref:Bicarbonate transporter BicA n=1 Tax=Caballeronia terrestris TaxID=1226301 RepID=A0A158JBU3_9BURK|nr:SulP family inorganic anion transporter [Caballeronia terrestris]SAL66277.1 Bicarbonate transporter BicA [Caballeronia terrestris]